MTIADLSAYEMRYVPSVDVLCELVADRHESGEPTVLLAGGTDWMVEQEMRPAVQQVEALPLLVDISRLRELRGIRIEGDRLRIGAATTYLEMRRHDGILSRAPLFACMARDVGAIQIQARGTLGGNLATGSPAADGVAALAAFDADVVVRSVRGERRIPMGELQTGYKTSRREADEVIVAFEMDLPPPHAPWIWRKVGTRRAQAISKVALAAVADVHRGEVRRMGCGMASVAPVTALMPATRALALSRSMKDIDAAAVDAAVDADVAPIDDIRSTGQYRRHVARAVTRAWFRLLGASC